MMVLRIKSNQISKLHTFEKEVLLSELNKEVRALKESKGMI